MAVFDPTQKMYSRRLCAFPMRAAAAIVSLHGGVEGSMEVEVAVSHQHHNRAWIIIRLGAWLECNLVVTT